MSNQGNAEASTSSSAPVPVTVTVPRSVNGPVIVDTVIGADGIKELPHLFELVQLEDLIVLIASMLDKLILHNDRIPLTPNSLTRFHSRAPPSINVLSYLLRIARYTNVEPCCLLILLPYVDKVCARLPSFTISSLTVHRFIIAGISVGSKALSDAFCTNGRYARVGGVSIAEMNLLEKEFCEAIDWRLTTTGAVLSHYYLSLVHSHPLYRLNNHPPPLLPSPPLPAPLPIPSSLASLSFLPEHSISLALAGATATAPSPPADIAMDHDEDTAISSDPSTATGSTLTPHHSTTSLPSSSSATASSRAATAAALLLRNSSSLLHEHQSSIAHSSSSSNGKTSFSPKLIPAPSTRKSGEFSASNLSSPIRSVRDTIVVDDADEDGTAIGLAVELERANANANRDVDVRDGRLGHASDSASTATVPEVSIQSTSPATASFSSPVVISKTVNDHLHISSATPTTASNTNGALSYAVENGLVKMNSLSGKSNGKRRMSDDAADEEGRAQADGDVEMH